MDSVPRAMVMPLTTAHCGTSISIVWISFGSFVLEEDVDMIVEWYDVVIDDDDPSSSSEFCVLCASAEDVVATIDSLIEL